MSLYLYECKAKPVATCSEEIHKKLGLEYQSTLDCVAKSYNGQDPVNHNNEILKADKER